MRSIDLYELLTLGLMNNFTNRHFPKKMLSRTHFKMSNHQRISTEILASVKQKNKLDVKYLQTKRPKQLDIYKKLEIR